MVDISFTMILQWLNFGVLLYILYYLLFKPLVKFLDQRAGEIKTDLEEARQKNARATEVLADYEAKTAGFQKDAEKFMENVRKEADAEREKILHEAREEAHRVMERGREEIRSEIAVAKDQLRKEFARTAVQCAEKILEKEVKQKDHDAIIKEFLQSGLR